MEVINDVDLSSFNDCSERLRMWLLGLIELRVRFVRYICIDSV